MRFILFISLFLIIYPFTLFVFPIESRVFISIFGLILFLFGFSFISRFRRKYFILFLLSILIAYLSIVTLLINNEEDLQFVKYPLNFFSFLFMGYFIYKVYGVVYKGREAPFEIISIYFIAVVLFQSLIAMIMYLVPGFLDFWLSITIYDENVRGLIDSTRRARIIGVSRHFFAGGVINGFALILISYLIVVFKFSNRNFFLLVFSYILIFLIGMFISRSTMIGFIISVLLLILGKNWYAGTISLARWLGLACVLFVLILLYYFLNDSLEFSKLSRFGFEMFYKFNEGEGLKTSSTDHLKTMYILPDSFKTWFFGDGLWYDNGGYYKNTDVGFLRLIYYFGLIGLFLFLVYSLYACYFAFGSGLLFFCVFMYFLTLNLKGFTDLSFIFMLFLFFPEIKGVNQKIK